jgi:hypothetical protein
MNEGVFILGGYLPPPVTAWALLVTRDFRVRETEPRRGHADIVLPATRANPLTVGVVVQFPGVWFPPGAKKPTEAGLSVGAD